MERLMCKLDGIVENFLKTFLFQIGPDIAPVKNNMYCDCYYKEDGSPLMDPKEEMPQ